MVGIKVKITSARQLDKRLQQAVQEAKKDLRFLRSAGSIIVSRAKNNLKEQGYKENKLFKRWAPLANSTLEAKKRAGYPTKILEREGNMRRLLGYTTLDRDLKITSEDYLIYHQYGTKTMPQRKVVSVADEDLERIRAAFERVLVEKMKKINAGRTIRGYKSKVLSTVKTRLEGEFE